MARFILGACFVGWTSLALACGNSVTGQATDDEPGDGDGAATGGEPGLSGDGDDSGDGDVAGDGDGDLSGDGDGDLSGDGDAPGDGDGDAPGDGDGDDAPPVNLSIIASPGEACFTENQLGCAGVAQADRIICLNGVWADGGTCPTDQNCDTREGPTGGTCQDIVPECAILAPGYSAFLCSGNTPQLCGPDLVSLVPDFSCANFEGCVDGECLDKLPECSVLEPGALVCHTDEIGAETAFECGPTLASRENEEECEHFCQNGSCTARPSCDGLPETCGPQDWSNCCSSRYIQGGAYYPGTEEDTIVNVSSFRLDHYEVTVGRFRKFVRAVTEDGWRPAEGSGKHTHANGGIGLEDFSGFSDGWDALWNEPSYGLHATTADWNTDLSCDSFPTWSINSTGGRENKPINCVNWYQAQAFCIWDGGFLPSFHEWQFAAKGGAENLPYPWGPETPSATRAAYECLYTDDDDCLQNDIPEVGNLPSGTGWWGHSDLGGSMYEYTLEPSGGWFVVMGGGWDGSVAHLQNGVWNPLNPTPATRAEDVGFRCAHSP